MSKSLTRSTESVMAAHNLSDAQWDSLPASVQAALATDTGPTREELAEAIRNYMANPGTREGRREIYALLARMDGGK